MHNSFWERRMAVFLRCYILDIIQTSDDGRASGITSCDCYGLLQDGCLCFSTSPPSHACPISAVPCEGVFSKEGIPEMRGVGNLTEARGGYQKSRRWPRLEHDPAPRNLPRARSVSGPGDVGEHKLFPGALESGESRRNKLRACFAGVVAVATPTPGSGSLWFLHKLGEAGLSVPRDVGFRLAGGPF